MPGIGALWDSLVDCICRPPRDEYIYPDELVGGRRGHFRVGRYPGIREDLTLINKRGLRLQCSHYFPRHVKGRDGRLPCVIYCHCNSGSRRDAEEAICVLVPIGVSVFTLDFAGSGLSDGQWVTLGSEEVEDVEAAVEHLRAGGRVSTLGLWGRSMGAVTALLYSQRDPSIAGMVLDSPFARLTDLMLEIVAEQRLPIPRPLARLALAAMRRSVNKRAGFDITRVSPLDAVSRSFIPALFGHATGDTFIRISHAEALHAAYAGDKNLIRFEGDHNSRRPQFFYNSVSIFWHNTLQLEHLLEPADIPLSPPTHGRMGPATTASSLSTTTAPARAPATAATTTAAAAAAGAAAVLSSSPSPPLPQPPGRPLRPPVQSPSHAPSPSGAAAAHAATATAASAAAAESRTTDGGGDDDANSAVDVAAPGGSVYGRSAPWEPRMWEWDVDRSERERQRFRRMAGGLPSPLGAAAGGASNHSETSTASTSVGGALPLSPLSGGSGAAATGSGTTNGGGGGSARGPGSNGVAATSNRGYPTSAELAHLLANANDHSVVTRLLGEDPNWSDGAAAAARGGGEAGAEAASGGGDGGSDPRVAQQQQLGGMGAGIGADGLLLLPGSLEEEEEHLRAALELSLMEAAAAAEAAVADANGSPVGKGIATEGLVGRYGVGTEATAEVSATAVSAAVGRMSPEAAAAVASGASATPLVPPHLASSSLSSPGTATVAAVSSTAVGSGGGDLLVFSPDERGQGDLLLHGSPPPHQQQQHPYPTRLPPLPSDYLTFTPSPAPSASASSSTSPWRQVGPATMQQPPTDTSNGLGSSPMRQQPDTVVPVPGSSSGAASASSPSSQLGRPQPHQPHAYQPLVATTADALNSPGAVVSAASWPMATAAAPVEGTAATTSPAGSGSGVIPVRQGGGGVGAVGGYPGGGGGGYYNGGGGAAMSLYDMCTEEELLALAVQLSLQEKG
ncbi:hypothetical protein Agub_g14291 [Astrephomene gubernaculifera]|uniref:Serine aminopeptidase S33 domain-containing protein n=1 Tax=Astrephomene gubernaculifera TaxID=47775 RepID=A0AAD3HST5_9CHLO|nr:hypothetical protein Agub_g14291 [Astrephomene gubernaculifera]